MKTKTEPVPKKRWHLSKHEEVRTVLVNGKLVVEIWTTEDLQRKMREKTTTSP